MKLNNKGFSMVELLAAISIMAILTGVAITAVTRYQDKARQKSYQAMETSAFDAAQNYIQDKGLIITSSKTILITTLVDEGYLPNLEDPANKGSYCHSGSQVVVTKITGSSGTLDKYRYAVTIKCKKYTSSGVVFES